MSRSALSVYDTSTGTTIGKEAYSCAEAWASRSLSPEKYGYRVSGWTLIVFLDAGGRAPLIQLLT